MPTQSLNAAVAVTSVCVRIFGQVQGWGVRPVVARLAMRLQLNGSVCNTADGLTVHLEGCPKAVESFIAEFPLAIPDGASVDRVETESEPSQRHHGFHIAGGAAEGAGAAAVPLDRVVCPDCIREVRDSTDRRRDYGFTSCVACGPRYSIIKAMPYDRPLTTMRTFTMCSSCGHEYCTPDDRRFHAQTSACPECGPKLRFIDDHGKTITDDKALDAAVCALRNGRIVALKGIGGYQLLVDATSCDAVRRLRNRKQRPSKPLAVLVASIAQAEELAVLTAVERRMLVDPAGPIIVGRRRTESPLSTDVAPGFASVGVMLPTTPFHQLICERFGHPLVCTSGNREGEPMVFDSACAERELRGIADVRLHHDRDIARPIDDSVIRVVAGSPSFLRLARGYAPHVLPWPAGLTREPAVALGGEQKAAIALFNGSQAVLGPHIGDLTNVAACERWIEQLNSMTQLYGIEFDSAEIAHDRHPDYFSTRHAERYRRRLTVQHHHAHIAAVLLEHGEMNREVLGISWDGTGYGDDGTLWGGEFLRANSAEYRRVARLRPFALAGGEQAIREPWRVATTLVAESLGPESATRLAWPDVSASRLRAVVDVSQRPRLSSMTSSMGRLFDAVAALALGVSTAAYEGRPAMLLEEACVCDEDASYAFGYHAETGDIDWRPVIASVVNDVRLGTAPGVIAMRFHRAAAGLIGEVAGNYSDLPLATAGGVFQNAILGELLLEQFSRRRITWLRPQSIPPGDGGLAAGQLAVVAGRRLRNQIG